MKNQNPLLDGVKVLDLSRLLPGPFCSLYMAQMGAEVIKIEEPNGGDYARAMSPQMYELANRGKKSITLDLRKDQDREAFLKLAEKADVVLESFRPGVMDKLGCGYETLRAVNPRLIFAALTGYGHTGPYRNRPGHDMNYRGYAGELDQTATAERGPFPGNYQVADIAGGALTCLVGILGALFGARASGHGTFVDAAMLDGTLAMQLVSLAFLRESGHGPLPGQSFLSGTLPNYSVYECADGKYLALGSLEPKFFQEVLKRVGREDLLKMPAMGPNSGALRAELEALFKSKTRDAWEAELADFDTCASAILSLQEVLENEQVKARGIIEQHQGKPAFAFPIPFSHAQTRSGPAPELGQHNAEILGR
ncbi:MAG: CaiB/BaiF CoA transferase family protein [Panacagrimonas sp.]